MGAAILVAMQTGERKSNRIYVVGTGDEVVVKRAIDEPTGGWLLVSDNPDKKKYPTRPWPKESRLIAEVVWHEQSYL